MNPWIRADWPAAKNIHAVTTLRLGGTSQGIYSSLNLATHVNDDAKNVESNRQCIVKGLELPAQPIWLQQTHSNTVVQAEKASACQQADASYTHQAQVVCTVLTADCLPVLLASRDGSTIAAIHAGWRGLLNGIISNTVAALGTKELIAWLGPAIGVECFEVGSEVKQLFVSKSINYNQAFKLKGGQKYWADIYQLARIELETLGITDVFGGGFCTMTDKQRFYSYRREGETGRMATLIWRD